ncbi:hypothetical protein Tco_0312435 [Tanacetum coccineum]
MIRKERVTGNVLDAVIQIISLAIVQNHLATKFKRPSLEVLGAIAKMTRRTRNTTMKLVSWLNRPIVEAATNNMNCWIEEEEDPEMEEEEDPEMEEEEEEMDVDADEEWDGLEWMLPYQGADPLNPPPPASDSESEIEFEEAEAEAEVAPIPPPPVPVDHEPKAEAATVGTGRLTPLTRLFANT